MICELCKREIPSKILSIKHHLTPIHKGGRNEGTALFCKPCGEQVHKLYSNSELKFKYNSLELLLKDEKIKIWVNWVKKSKEFNVCMKTKKRK